MYYIQLEHVVKLCHDDTVDYKFTLNWIVLESHLLVHLISCTLRYCILTYKTYKITGHSRRHNGQVEVYRGKNHMKS